MNKTAIRNYATWARTRLIEQVGQQAFSLGFSREGAQSPEFVGADAIIMNGSVYDAKFKEQREKLRGAIVRKGYDTVMEEAAYTWFNRFAAIRFMEVNGFLEHGIRVLSSTTQGKTDPDVLGKATTVNTPTDKTFIFRCIENSRSEDLFRHLILAQCHELNKAMPFLFEPITDYTELLFPANLLQEGSVIRRLVQDIPEKDWEDVEIVGWLYQYYISEKKDEVYAALKKGQKVGKESIPAATQLFTPHWVVRYMVENSLGQLWLDNHPDSELRTKWKYSIDPAPQSEAVQQQLRQYIRPDLEPEKLTILDPACGSGHILVYAFDLLYDIYVRFGYSMAEIPRLILTKNLFGLDIDERAVQLSGFAVMMKARSKDPEIFSQPIPLNITAVEETPPLSQAAKKLLSEGLKDKSKLDKQIQALWEPFRDAKNLGSLIALEGVDFPFWQERLQYLSHLLGHDDLVAVDTSSLLWPSPVQETQLNFSGRQLDLFEREMAIELLEALPALLKQASLLSDKYDAVVTNPPYMGGANMNSSLNEHISKMFPDAKGDLFACFIRRGFGWVKPQAFCAMVTMQSWMFLSSFEKLRTEFLVNKTIYTMTHMANMVMGIAFGTAATVWRNNYIPGYKGTFSYVDISDIEDERPKSFPVINDRYSVVSADDFAAIPGSPIAYWTSDAARKAFQAGTPLGDIAKPRQGLATSDNDRFIKLWHEVPFSTIRFNCNSQMEANRHNSKWYPYNKGGAFRKWYGNNEYVINWANDGYEVKEYARTLYKSVTRTIKNIEHYFKPCITWSFISSSRFGVRYSPPGFIFDVAGSSVFAAEKETLYLTALLCSSLTFEFLKTLNPTLNFQAGNLATLPVLWPIDSLIRNRIEALAKECIDLSKYDWDMDETSWDFARHPLLSTQDSHQSPNRSVSKQVGIYHADLENRFQQLKTNETELNQLFLHIYSLEGEYASAPEDSDITIRRPDLGRDIRSFLSYTVGCMMGRYSLDTPGLIYAGGVFDSSKYSSVPADDDAIISVLDDNWFPDDVSGRFVDFLRVTFGDGSLTTNLDFIANALGRTATETSIERIRKYFVSDFYKDHLKVYQKRPIYWLFTSGKEKAFQALVYMHRYDKSTLSRMRSEYLHTLQNKLTFEIQRLSVAEQSSTTMREKQAAAKRLTELMKKQEELRKYDELLRHMADQQIEIDLDDGVKVNYAKFNGLVAPI